MKQDAEKTKVIFRMTRRAWGSEVVAVFPDLAGDMNPHRTCLCYAHIGQHSAISTDYPQWTRPARPEECANLKAELESLGYDLRVAKRATHKDFLARKEQTR